MLKIFFFGFVPKSPTQMGSLSAKNASKKFSRLGTFKGHERVLVAMRVLLEVVIVLLEAVRVFVKPK